ncbi:amino acid transporter [Dactylosporangium siamense]|uniref:Amino acid transporter n=1 Tax=Dactylosporangium siamense TaxID=685454 RepID=A0A919U6S2_9ACTN|nr:amino acid transporter [Dactylosporangium siamense]GIG43782.1 amino acid transporter [Dactylosporangium siamense]
MTGIRAWLLSGINDRSLQHAGPGAKPAADRRHPWWKVMCLTGVDYFSTLGYQPGIAALAAGLLAPVATVVLILVTLLGALPVYRRVAAESPHGEGSIAMLVRLLPFWQGKLFVLVLLGFAATDFIITMTLSAADATAHLDENPFWPAALHDHEVPVTLVLLGLLGGVFLIGFTEAVGIAVAIVGVYLTLNMIVVVDGLWLIATDPSTLTNWSSALTARHGNPLLVVAIALVVFPKLALGLSGFETGVAVMPHVRGDPADSEEHPAGRIRDTRKLLTTAALIMSGFLLTTSVITTVLIPPAEFKAGGKADGRALAYLAHEHLGTVFGTAYDLATIAILWFAGASAMAGLLNLVPRYLPRYGMAPDWAGAVRPLVLVFLAIAFLITVLFDADVNAQGGAYATGVLVLITSASVAAALSARRRRQRRAFGAFAVIAAVLVYTTIANIAERPDGVKIAGCFITGILLVSVLSRIDRSFELRVTDLQFDETASTFIHDCARRTIRLVAKEPAHRAALDYQEKLRQIQADNDIPDAADVIFVEVAITDASDFASAVVVRGEVLHGRYRVLVLQNPAVASAVAALLLGIRDRTGRRPHIYFEWTEGNPAANFLRFLIFGQGEIAPVTREVLRRQEPDRRHRPHVHVG